MYSSLVDEVSGLDEAGLTERFRELELRKRRIDVEMATIVREGERRGLNTVDGHRSMKHWVRAQINCASADAAGLRGLGKAMDASPGIGDALIAGSIGSAQAHELSRLSANPRCGDQLEGVLPTLLLHAEHLSYEDFRIVARRWETLADLDGAERNDEVSHERRTASVLDVNGSVQVRASGGTGAAAAEMIATFNQFVEAEFTKDVAVRTEQSGPDASASALPRTDAQRRFDAMQAIFRAAVVAPPDGISPKPVVNILVGLATLDRILARRGLGVEPDDQDRVDLAEQLTIERMESANGVVVAPDDVIAAALSGVVRRVVIDSAGVVVDAGRKRRLFTGVARELALLLWNRCDHLGCTVPGDRCDVDHTDEWEADGGRTDQANGRPRCSTHNPWKSRHRLKSKRDPAGYIVDFRADGTPMLPVGRRLIPDDGDHGDASDPPVITQRDDLDVELAELWGALTAAAAAQHSWTAERIHRTTACHLGTPGGRTDAVAALSDSFRR